MLRAGDPAYGDATGFKQLLQSGSREAGGIVDCQHLDVFFCINRDRSPEANRTGAGRAIEADVGSGLRRAGDEAGGLKGVPGGQVGFRENHGRAARRGARRDANHDLVVMDGERGDRRAVAPNRVIDAPGLGIRLRQKACVVADHVAGDGGDAGFGDSIGHGLERAQRMRVPIDLRRGLG